MEKNKVGKITEHFTANAHQSEEVREMCGKCRRETRHKIVTSYEQNGKEDCGEHYTIDWYNSWQVIQCQGCDDLSFRKEHFFSEDVHQIYEDEWEDGKSVTLYPKRNATMRTTKDFINVPPKLRNIYLESIEAFNTDSFILTAAGLRALVEGICAFLKISDGPVQQGGKSVRKRNLEGKIFGLNEMGHLTEAGANFLHEHRFMGNDAVHALRKPSRGNLSIAIDILEHSLDAIFELPAKAQELEASRKIATRKS